MKFQWFDLFIESGSANIWRNKTVWMKCGRQARLFKYFHLIEKKPLSTFTRYPTTECIWIWSYIMIGCVSGSFCDGSTMCRCSSPLNPRQRQPPWIPATLGALATLTTMTTAVRTPVERETVRNSSESCRNGKRKSWRNKKNSRNKRRKRIRGTNRWPTNSIQVGFLVVFVTFLLGRWNP